MEFYSLFQFIQHKGFPRIDPMSLSSKREAVSRCAPAFQRSFPALKIADRINKNDGGREGREGRKKTKRKTRKEMPTIKMSSNEVSRRKRGASGETASGESHGERKREM